MNISPLDIKKQEFTRGIRGYDVEEVQAFLDMMARQWEDVRAEQRRATERVNELKAKLQHYERVEEALQEALQTARENSRQVLTNAKEEAALIVQRAENEAEEIKRAAFNQRAQLERDIEELSGRRFEVVARLRAFLLSEVEILSRFEGDHASGSPVNDHLSARPTQPASSTAATAESGRAVDIREPADESTETVEPAPEADDRQPGVGYRRREEVRSFKFFQSSEGDEGDEKRVQGDAADDIGASVRNAAPALLLGDDPPRPLQDADDGPAEEWSFEPMDADEPIQEVELEALEDEAGEDETVKTTSEELEKIRRILSDLD